MSCDLFNHDGALFSPCRRWRYVLWRRWDPSKPWAMFIGLNPSTADEINNDPTVRRCIGYARSLGYGGLFMTNIFAYRATDPRVMKAFREPVGPENDRYLIEAAEKSEVVIAAWGNHGSFQKRSDHVRTIISVLHCLDITGPGEPKHPLYLKACLQPVLWTGRLLGRKGI